MKDKNNFFYQLIDMLDMNFYWVGNSFIPCDGEFDGECFYNYKNKNVLLIDDPLGKTKNLFSLIEYLFLYKFLTDLVIAIIFFILVEFKNLVCFTRNLTILDSLLKS